MMVAAQRPAPEVLRRAARRLRSAPGAFGAAVSRRRAAPLGLGDVVRYGVATATVSRTMAKDPITSPLRAPLKRFTDDTTGPAELEEEVRGRGRRKAIGELVTCPFCHASWVATPLLGADLVRPEATRAVADVGDALRMRHLDPRLSAASTAFVVSAVATASAQRRDR